MPRVVAIIPARGGSRGIPRKNLIDFCGKPLIAWSVEQAVRAGEVGEVWVSSDSEEILEVAESYGASSVRRPESLAGDEASSESAWLHAVEEIEARTGPVDVVVGMQATNPLRAPSDLDGALRAFREGGFDSLLTCCEVEDFFMWRIDPESGPEGVNHDYRNRKRRQAIEKRYLENGSFYVFTPGLLRERQNRLGGRIGIFVMDPYKMFQIDDPEDVQLCQVIMRGYGLDRLP